MIQSPLTTAQFKQKLINSIQNYVINAKDNPKQRKIFVKLAKEDHLILATVLGQTKTNQPLSKSFQKFNQFIDRRKWQAAVQLIEHRNLKEGKLR